MDQQQPAGVRTFGNVGDPPVVVFGGTADFCAAVARGLRYVLCAGAEEFDRPADPVHVVGVGDGLAAARSFADRIPSRCISLTLVGADPAAVVSESGEAAVRAVLRRTSGGWDDQGDRLARRAIAAGDPTGWFDRLYSAGARGEVDMPWDRVEPHPLLAEWADGRDGTDRRAIVVGCGLGADAEYVASLGFRTRAFDVSPTALQVARERHPASAVEYVQGDLLRLPVPWLRAFDLVVEVITVQALPDPPRGEAIANVGRLVAPGGTLIVVEYRIEAASEDPRDCRGNAGSASGTTGTTPEADARDRAAQQQVHGPPWPLRPAEIDRFAADGLTVVRIERTTDPRRPGSRRWRAEFTRPR